MKKYITMLLALLLLLAIPAWGVIVTLDQPYYNEKPATTIKMDRVTIAAGYIEVPLKLLDEDGRQVSLYMFRIIDNPPIYAYNTSGAIIGTVYPGDTDFSDLISTPLASASIGSAIFVPLRNKIKIYVLNKLGITGN